MKILVETIPYSKMRYKTQGDWWWEESTLIVKVCILNNMWYELLIAFHEIVEAILCRYRGIAEKDVTAFDIDFETGRCCGEPGDDINAPYSNEHNVATGFERILCSLMNITWSEYDSFNPSENKKKG